MAEKFHDDWEVVPFNLNMKPEEDPDANAIERQLEAMALRQRSSAQSYHAQPVLTAPVTPKVLSMHLVLSKHS